MRRLMQAVLMSVGSAALAHVHVAGPAFAGTTQELHFEVGHGCSGADTMKVTIDIPSSVVSVRPGESNLGKATVTRDAAGLATAVTFEKPVSEVLAADDNFYKMNLRIKVPNAPFTTLRFVSHQTCRAADGTETTVHWDGTAEEAPEVLVLPARQPGWNRYTVPVAVSDLKTFFGDAAIVWKGNAAWSPNATTVSQISSTRDVTALSSLSANDEVWVKY